MDVADLLIDVGDGCEVDRLIFIFGDGVEVALGDFYGRVDIPMRFVEVNELNEGLGGIAFGGEPTGGFRTNNVGRDAGFGSFGYAVANPTGFVEDLGVVVGGEPIVEAVVVHGWDVIDSLIGPFHLHGDEGVVPFTDVGSLVSVFSEELRNGDGCFRKVRKGARAATNEAIDSVVVGHAAGKGGRAGRGADGGWGVEVGEGRSVFGEVIEVRSFDMGVTRVSEVAVAEVIGDDDDDVGFLGSF